MLALPSWRGQFNYVNLEPGDFRMSKYTHTYRGVDPGDKGTLHSVPAPWHSTHFGRPHSRPPHLGTPRPGGGRTCTHPVRPHKGPRAQDSRTHSSLILAYSLQVAFVDSYRFGCGQFRPEYLHQLEIVWP